MILPRLLREIRELRQLDLDKNGSIDPSELEILRSKRVVKLVLETDSWKSYLLILIC